jgi:hypothetical protein
MIENIFYSIPSEPNLLPGCSRPRGSGSACDEQDPSFPCIGSVKVLIEHRAKKTAHGTAEAGHEQICNHQREWARILASHAQGLGWVA